MMLDRMEGNAELKSSVQLMLAARRLTHSVLLVGEEGLGAGFAARCIAADYLYPAGGAPAEALLRGECCRAVGKPGDRDSGHVETGIVREAISVAGMGAGGKYLVSQVKAMRSEIFNTSLSAEGRAVLLYHVEKMNEESANALLKVMEEPPEGVLFLLTADSLAGVLPTIRSRCVSFAVAPVSPADCTRYCAAQGVDKKTAALYSELFDGHIGTVLAVARDEARAAQVEKALELARAAAARDSYTAAVLLAAYEKDKAAAAALLTDFRAVAAAGLGTKTDSPETIGASGDANNAYTAGTPVGSYLAELGFNLDFAPAADLKVVDGNAAGSSSYGTDAATVASFVTGMQTGLQEQKVTAAIGHFPGIGSTTQSTKNGMASTDRSAEDFRANEFAVFQSCIDSGETKMITVSNMAAPSLTGDNTPCSFSSAVVTDILRNELNFRGVIVSGAMNQTAITNYYGADEAAVLALRAGCDMIYAPENFETAYNGVLEAVQNGTISEERVNDSLRRIYRIKYADKIEQ